MRQVKMTRLDLEHGKIDDTLDYVAEEVPLQVTVNGAYSFVIWSSPSQFKELAVGHLYAEDILHDVDEIQALTEDEAKNLCQVTLKPSVDLDERLKNQRRGTRIIPLIKASTSAYQHDDKLPIVKSDLTIKAQVILDAVDQMNTKANGFKKNRRTPRQRHIQSRRRHDRVLRGRRQAQHRRQSHRRSPAKKREFWRVLHVHYWACAG